MSDGGAPEDAATGDSGEPLDGGADASTVDAGADAGASSCDDRVASYVEGVLTTVPELATRVAPFGFRLLSLNAIDDPSSGTIVFAEIRNDSDRTRCDFLPRVTAPGLPPIYGALRTPPYVGLAGLTTDCLAPGEVGVFAGSVGRALEEVVAAGVLDFALEPGDILDPIPEPARGVQLEGERVVPVAGGAAIATTVVTSVAVENVFYAAYGRDDRGVLSVERAEAVSELAPIAAGARIDLVTTGYVCPFDSVVSFLSWIDQSE